MVSFKQIQDAFANNPCRNMEIPRHQVGEEESVEMFKIVKSAPPPTVTPAAPSVVPVMPNIPPPAPVVHTAAPVVHPMPSAVPVMPNIAPPAAPSRSQKSKRPVDPLLLDMDTRDAMYEIASPVVRQEIEIKEAHRIESLLNTLYAAENGRARGWTKTHLAEFLKPRTISGGGGGTGSRSAAAPFDWSAVFSDKKLSAALDFVALAKGIRVAVWNPAEKVVGIWPAADRMDTTEAPPVYHVSVTGLLMPEKTSVFETGWTLRAPFAVEHSLEKLSLEELSNIAESLGLTAAELSGKKTDRVRLLATTRMIKRFQ
jgi:hypothetical protein